MTPPECGSAKVWPPPARRPTCPSATLRRQCTHATLAILSLAQPVRNEQLIVLRRLTSSGRSANLVVATRRRTLRCITAAKQEMANQSRTNGSFVPTVVDTRGVWPSRVQGGRGVKTGWIWWGLVYSSAMLLLLKEEPAAKHHFHSQGQQGASERRANGPAQIDRTRSVD
ncbi:hypothetical protein MTO96_048353 [Rhipicephalus appendiculatus]